MKLVKSAAGDAFVFEENSVELLTETSFVGGGVTETDLRPAAFADFFNAHFSELAALYPEFAELEKGMRAVGLAKFIKDNNIPVDLNWLSKASLPDVMTPVTTPAAHAEKTVTLDGTSFQLSLSVTGGVDYNLFNGQNFQYVLDSENQAAGLRDAAADARSSDLQKEWQVELDGTVYNAAALSLSPTKKDGSFHWKNTDLSYGTEAGFPLAFQRYYDSFLARETTDLGYGWVDVPYELDFPVADVLTTFGSGENQVQATIPPKILFTNWASHQLLEFTPDQRQPDGRIIYAPKDKKIARELFVLNPDGSYIYRRDGNEIYFDSNGVLQKLKDRNGNELSYIYNAQAKLSRIKDQTSGQEIALTYDAQGRVIQALGPDGRSVGYGYEAVSGDLKTVTRDWTNRSTTFDYNADHQLVKAVDYAGRVLFENEFDEIGRLMNQTNFLGNETQLNPNLLLQQTTTTNSVTGAQSGKEYNKNFQVTSQTNALGEEVKYTYGTSLFGPESMTDAQGNTTYFTYDAFGNVSQVTDIYGNKTNYHYTRIAGDNRLLFVETANGRGTAYGYDVKGNLTDIYEGARILSIAANGDLTIELTNLHTYREYDAKGQLALIRNAKGDEVHYAYDAVGNVTLVRDGLGHEIQMTYLQRNGIITNLLSSVTDALGRSVQYVYDSVTDLLKSVTTAAGVTQYFYDLRDRLTSIQDALGRKLEWVYNAKDQLVSTINKSVSGLAETNSQVNYGYDTLGRRISIAGALGAATGFAYDLLNRIKRVTISAPASQYGALNDLTIDEVEPEQVRLSFETGADIDQVKVRYKAQGAVDFTEILIDNPLNGLNEMTLKNLAEMTAYEVELELTDLQGRVSYSRNYQFKTKQVAPPVVENLKAEDIMDHSAVIQFEVSKGITEINLSYHVLGEAKDNKVKIQGLQNGMIPINLESLRSGLTYKVEVTVKDAQGRESILKSVQFKTLGEPSPEDSIDYREAEARYGRVIRTLTTEVYISIEHENVIDPTNENYSLTLRNAQGDIVSSGISANLASGANWGRVLWIQGLTPNTDYSYILTMTSRSDIPAATGVFKTSAGTDTTLPNTGFRFYTRDSESLVFAAKPTEDLLMMEVTLTDQVTQAIKTYRFFNLKGGEYSELLLNGLEPGRTYAIKWAMVDMNGNRSNPAVTFFTSTTGAEDETPPVVTQRLIVARDSTTATVKVVTNELLRKMKVQYRVVGTNEWLEQSVVRTDNTFQLDITGLQAGVEYEYRYVLEDLSGNLLITDWTIL